MVSGRTAKVKIELDPVVVVSKWRMKKKDARHAKRIARENQAYFAG
jgi:hypothetical protein